MGCGMVTAWHPTDRQGVEGWAWCHVLWQQRMKAWTRAGSSSGWQPYAQWNEERLVTEKIKSRANSINSNWGVLRGSALPACHHFLIYTLSLSIVQGLNPEDKLTEAPCRLENSEGKLGTMAWADIFCSCDQSTQKALLVTSNQWCHSNAILPINNSLLAISKFLSAVNRQQEKKAQGSDSPHPHVSGFIYRESLSRCWKTDQAWCICCSL